MENEGKFIMDKNIKLKFAKLSDLEIVCKLHLDIWRKINPRTTDTRIRKHFIDWAKNKEILLVFEKNKPIAYFHLNRDYWVRSFYIKRIGVIEGYEKVRDLALDKIIEMAKKEKVRRIFVDTNPIKGKEIINFYLKRGFSKCGYIKDNFGENENAIILSLKLESSRMGDFNKKLNRLLNIIVDTILSAKSKKEAAALTLWPIPTPQGMLFWGEEWSKKLNRILHLIEKRKVEDREIKRSLKFPSKIVPFLWRCGDTVKNSSLTKEEKLFIVKKLFEILALFRKENLFCKNGKNIIWDKKELEDNKRGLYFFSVRDRKSKKIISNFEAALYLYTELLYWAQHPFGHCFHGLYPDEKGGLLVREYFDLKPKVWNFSKNLNFSQVEIFEVYKRGTKIKLDFFERGIRTIVPFKQNLKSFALKVDAKPIKKLDEVSKFYDNLKNVIRKGSNFIQSLNEQQLIEKHSAYWFFVLKPLCDLVGEDWRPPQQVLNNIYKKYDKIRDVWQNVVKKDFEKTADLPLEQQKNILKEMFDPRV